MSALRMDDRGVIAACPSCGKQNRTVFARLGHPARCALCHAALSAAAAPVGVDATAAFNAVVRQSPVPVLVDFWAPWCGPCHTVAPQIDEAARRNAGRLVVVKVNIDNLQDVAARLGIKSIPTLALFVLGREVARTAGAISADQIEAFVRQAGA